MNEYQWTAAILITIGLIHLFFKAVGRILKTVDEDCEICNPDGQKRHDD